MRTQLRRFLLASLLLPLISCDATFPWSEGTMPQYSVLPERLSFSAVTTGSAPPDQRAYAHTQFGDGFFRAEFSSPVASVRVIRQYPGVASLDVTVVPPGEVPVGETIGYVDVIGCWDEGCSDRLPGSPHRIIVSYTVSVP